MKLTLPGVSSPAAGTPSPSKSIFFASLHFFSVRTDWPCPAQRLAPVRPVSPEGAARTVHAGGADLFVLAQRAKA